MRHCAFDSTYYFFSREQTTFDWTYHFSRSEFFLRSLLWTQVFREPYLSMCKHVIYYYISLWLDCKQLLCGLWSQGLAELERANEQRRELERGRSKRVSPSLSVFSLARLPCSLARSMLTRAALLADWCKRVSCVLTMDVLVKTSLNCRNFSHFFSSLLAIRKFDELKYLPVFHTSVTLLCQLDFSTFKNPGFVLKNSIKRNVGQ